MVVALLPGTMQLVEALLLRTALIPELRPVPGLVLREVPGWEWIHGLRTEYALQDWSAGVT
jgi:hypothetical protein